MVVLLGPGQDRPASPGRRSKLLAGEGLGEAHRAGAEQLLEGDLVGSRQIQGPRLEIPVTQQGVAPGDVDQLAGPGGNGPVDPPAQGIVEGAKLHFIAQGHRRPLRQLSGPPRSGPNATPGLFMKRPTRHEPTWAYTAKRSAGTVTKPARSSMASGSGGTRLGRGCAYDSAVSILDLAFRRIITQGRDNGGG